MKQQQFAKDVWWEARTQQFAQDEHWLYVHEGYLPQLLIEDNNNLSL